MKNYKYILEPYKGRSTRHICPGCKTPNVFSRYINFVTGEYLSERVGRCNREIKCTYHYTPSQYFADNPVWVNDGLPPQSLHPIEVKPGNPMPFSFIPWKQYKQFLDNYDKNSLISYLRKKIGDRWMELLVEYYFGTSPYWSGATAFPQIDSNGYVRQVKIMDYDPDTGKRKKSEDVSWRWNDFKKVYTKDINRGDKIVFAGKQIIKDPNAHFQQCFFGEHLLTEYPYSEKPVAIVESEKTALIASLYLREFVWIATGGIHGCKWSTKEVYHVLAGRDVVLFPDLNAIEKWETKAAEIRKAAKSVTFSKILEKYATQEEREAGLDIADYLLRFSLEDFCKNELNPLP